MDITDIFDGVTPAPSPGAHLPPGLVMQADVAARAHDAALVAQRRYDAARERALAEIEARLEPLKAEADTATSHADDLEKALQAAMEVSQVGEIPLPGRGQIYIKTIAGKKKSVTKGFLEKALGDKKAEEVWKQVPTTPEQRVLVIPPRFEDEPLT